MSPAERDFEVALRLQASGKHPDLEVVDTGIFVDTVEFSLNANNTVLEEAEEDLVALVLLDVYHTGMLVYKS